MKEKITDMNEDNQDYWWSASFTLTFDYFTEPQMAREVYQEVFAKDLLLIHHLLFRHKEGKLDRCSI
jgi:hypothetical protein